MAEQPSRQQAFPTPGELGRLPEQLRMTIPAEWEDRNEHVNVQYYVTLYELGGWTVLEDEGIDEKWFQQREISLHSSNDLAEDIYVLASRRGAAGADVA